jgi:hypothetical protein
VIRLLQLLKRSCGVWQVILHRCKRHALIFYLRTRENIFVLFSSILARAVETSSFPADLNELASAHIAKGGLFVSRKHAFQGASRITIIDSAGCSYGHPLEALRIRKSSRCLCAEIRCHCAFLRRILLRPFFLNRGNASRTRNRKCPDILATRGTEATVRAVARTEEKGTNVMVSSRLDAEAALHWADHTQQTTYRCAP